MKINILGIESSCDETSAAVVADGVILSNVIASQDVHKTYGGVVPELASRAHQQNIVPVVDQALRQANLNKTDISGVAFTRGPGLLGSLLVGSSFAKGFVVSREIPLIEINHLQAHVLSHFLKESSGDSNFPDFPFLCLLVSGGHTQLVVVEDYLEMKTIGQTIDDAAGEAFDKCAKILGFQYPGGPLIDEYALKGFSGRYKFTKPKISDLDYSFSGLKTAFLYFIRDNIRKDPDFIKNNLNDLCASIQSTIVEILLDKFILASENTGINEIAIAGGVAANSYLRKTLKEEAKRRNWNLFLPDYKYTTDNAAMVAITGYYKYLKQQFTDQKSTPLARMKL